MAPKQLFSKVDVMDIVYHEKQHVRETVDKLGPADFEGYDADALTDKVLGWLTLAPPEIRDEDIYADQRECQVDARMNPQRRMFMDHGQSFMVSGTELKVHVPFDGDPDYFGISPTVWSSAGYPRAEIVDKELIFIFQGETLDGAAIKNRYLGEIGEIKKYLASIDSTLKQHYSELKPTIRQLITARQEKLKQAADIGNSLGIPIRKKEGVPTAFAIPLPKRERPAVKAQVKSVHSSPEPTLAKDEYNYILSVLKYMSHVMEKHPEAFKTQGEEELRAQFLVHLNGQYQGQATGETFNFGGKTDILLNVEGRNVFIAECKIWKGEVVLHETIDQLLSYLSWRDTKAAILIFNRNKNLSSVLDTIRSAVPKHPCFTEALGEDDETTFRYKFHNPDDKGREMLISIMTFDVPI